MSTTEIAPAPARVTEERESARRAGRARGVAAATSGAFLVLWTSGYIVGTFGAQAVPPLALNFWRFTAAAGLLALVAGVTRAPWPRTPRAWAHLAVTGVLLQAVQFGGVYIGIASGVSAAMSSLVIGMAPVVVAAGATVLLGERLSRRGWFGSALGIAGVALALGGDVRAGGGAGLLATFTGMAGFAAGTLYQRRFADKDGRATARRLRGAGGATGVGGMDLRTGGAVQLAAGALAILPLALLVPVHGHTGLAVPLTTAALWPLAWMAVVNSIGGITLLFVLVRRRGAAGGTGLLYLVPPLTAVAGAPILHQPLGLFGWAGLVVATAGVLLTQRAR